VVAGYSTLFGIGGRALDEHKKKSVQLDFDAIAIQDAEHFEMFKISPIDIFLIGGFFILFIVVFMQFFTRYVLNDSVAWTEEAARYLLITVSFSGAIRCQLQGTHIALEFMDQHYGRYKNIVSKFVLLVTAILFAVLVFSCWQLIQKTSFQQMVSLPFPKYYLHSVILILVGTSFVVALVQLFGGLKLPR
jgi:TRAP-type C4-dicarboxylate transport system permease small subunit